MFFVIVKNFTIDIDIDIETQNSNITTGVINFGASLLWWVTKTLLIETFTVIQKCLWQNMKATILPLQYY